MTEPVKCKMCGCPVEFPSNGCHRYEADCISALLKHNNELKTEQDRLARRVIALQEMVDDAAGLLRRGRGDRSWRDAQREWQLCREEV